ncbi:MAG: methylated-DNA--[protein]-cysteine S-methyltransferase [Alphaproteobacteria bacterium]|nr:methylated-DNA--[protein]-cysteine S-methyltransferase [Alphaproteobacteria bacterium]
MNQSLWREELPTPIGTVVLVGDGECLVALEFADRRDLLLERLAKRYGTTDIARRTKPSAAALRVADYFAGNLTALADLETDPGGSPFERRVWDALRQIACGTTTSYGALAAAVDRPGAARAVGAANARNPIALVIPCHRVIGAGGELTGYAGGLERKRWLLCHEGAVAA